MIDDSFRKAVLQDLREASVHVQLLKELDEFTDAQTTIPDMIALIKTLLLSILYTFNDDEATDGRAGEKLLAYNDFLHELIEEIRRKNSN